ncbi:MAG: DegV family protein [Bacillota bacterium]
MHQKEYQIITDATSDLPAKLAEEYGLVVIPMQVEQGGVDYLFGPVGAELQPKAFYQNVRAGQHATTSQVNSYTFVDAFTPFLEKGIDVLYIGFSSALSGTFQASTLAAEELRPRFPERRIVCIDSLAACLGEGLLVCTAAKKQREGMGFDEVCAFVEENKLKLCHWFTVDDLMHLKRGGRLSATSAILGTALKIKPVMHVDDEGRLVLSSKVQGRKHSLKALVKQMESTFLPDMSDAVMIGHGDAIEDALLVKGLIEEQFGVKDILIDYIGPVIGAHSGPGTIALFFFGTKR